jgi:hypothetical protein
MFASFLRLSTTEQQSGSIITSMPAFPQGARAETLPKSRFQSYRILTSRY